MKKSTKVAIICFVLFVVEIIAIQIINITDDKTTYNTKPLIIIGCLLAFELIIGLIVCIIRGFKYSKRVKQMYTAFSNKNYTYVVENKDICAKFKNGKGLGLVNLTIALSYLELGNIKDCLSYLEKIQDKRAVHYKYFWKSVCLILVNDAEQFKHYQQILQRSDYANDKECRILELIEKKKILNNNLSENEQSFIDNLNSDAIKNIFK